MQTEAPTTTPATAVEQATIDRPAAAPSARRRFALATLMVVALVAGLVASASPASAWQYGAGSGRPGAVAATAQVNVGRLNIGAGPQITLYGNTGPTVTRSPGYAGAQDVAILYSVQRWNGSQWVQVTRQFNTRRIAAGVQRVTLPALYVIPTAGTGSYRVVEAFNWNVAGTNQVLGATSIYPSVASDHVCQYRPCAATVGYVWAG